MVREFMNADADSVTGRIVVLPDPNSDASANSRIGGQVVGLTIYAGSCTLEMTDMSFLQTKKKKTELN